MNFGVIGWSDVLRTGLSIFLITRKSKLIKVLGYLGVVGEIYSLTQKERGIDPMTGKPMLVAGGDALLPLTGKVPAQTPSGDGLMVPKFAGLGVLLQGYSGR